MVEGGIVFPIMAMFLVFLEMAHHSYDSYVTVTHVERERTWSIVTHGHTFGCDANDVKDDDTYSKNVKYFKMGSSSENGGGNTPAGGGADSPPTGSTGVSVGDTPGSKGFFKWQGQASAKTDWKRGPNQVQNTEIATGVVYCNQQYLGTPLDIIKNAIAKAF